MTEKLELCKWIYKNSSIPMRILAKKNVIQLRALKYRIIMDESEQINERMHANAHTAHEQLKNWK